MKKFALVAIFLVCGFSGFAFAAPNFYIDDPIELKTSSGPYSGGAPYTLVAHGDGQDNFSGGTPDAKLDWVWDDLDLSKLSFINKFDSDDNKWADAGMTDNQFGFTGRGQKTGTWTYLGGELVTEPNAFTLYFSLKAGNTGNNPNSTGGWNLYKMNANPTVGEAVTWSTLVSFFETPWDDGLDSKDISHISFWKGPGEPGDTVPEPATLFLFGFGLLGLAGMTRKKFDA